MLLPYKYFPVRIDPQEIRVLTILPGGFSDALVGRLHSMTLSEHAIPAYEALSYVWGNPTFTSQISIDSTDNPISSLGDVEINSNLDQVLRHLRYEDCDRVIWVDALCINQRDLQERSQQVAVMAKIYSRAEKVLAWLGPEGDDSSFALQFIERVGSSVRVDWNTRKVTSSGVLEHDLQWLSHSLTGIYLSKRQTYAVYNLFNRVWFERTWILQEIGLSKRALIICGEVQTLWTTFCTAFECILSCANFDFDDADIDEADERLKKRYEIISELVDPDKEIYIRHLRPVTGRTRCLDGKDKVYAVLSLLCPADKELNIVPDYSLTCSEAYTSVAKTWYTKRHSLELLASCGLERSLSDLPTWVPDWTGVLPYAEGGNESAGYDLNILCDPVFPRPGVLRVSGITSGTIKLSMDLSYLQADDTKWSPRLERLHDLLPFDDISEYAHGMTVVEVWCRTLCANQFADSYYPLREWLPLLSDVLQILESRRKGQTDEVVPQAYLARVLHITLGRKLFCLEDGWLLLGPECAAAGDIICTILGCSVPIVLRPVKTSEGSPSDQEEYTVVGDCYVQGLMNQEALFGQVPSPFARVLTQSVGPGIWRFLNKKTGTVQIEDPRLALSYSDDIQALMIEEGYDMTTAHEGRRLRVETIQAAGFEFKTFDLV